MRWYWLLAVLLLAVFDGYCLVFQWSAVAGNTAAAIIWATPAFAAHHVLTRRRQDRHHREQTGRAEAQAAQLATVTGQVDAMAAQVGQLHALHLHGVWPEDRHQGR